MADASSALGGRQIAGTWVNRRGTAKKLVSKIGASELGGVIGSIAAGEVTGCSSPVLVETPHFGRDAYLAVGETDVAVVRAKQGLMKLKLTGGGCARGAQRRDEGRAGRREARVSADDHIQRWRALGVRRCRVAASPRRNESSTSLGG